jgi:tRNA-dihydrouridine synthase
LKTAIGKVNSFHHCLTTEAMSMAAQSKHAVTLLLKIRRVVGPAFPIGIKINSTDNLEGGLTQDDALEVVRLLDQTSIDLIDISGGTYFPGAKASSDSSVQGPYFLDFARLAKGVTSVPLIVTGGFKKREQAIDAIKSGTADMVGIGRAMVLNPQLAKDWLTEEGGDPVFPSFEPSPPGGITAWYTMRLTALGEDRENALPLDLPSAIRIYEERDTRRCIKWKKNNWKLRGKG